ncbi:MAG: rhodanese-like domain-containing protein [Slackia sp.]
MGIFNMFGGGFDKKLEEARATQNARIIDVRTSGEYRSAMCPGRKTSPRPHRRFQGSSRYSLVRVLPKRRDSAQAAHILGTNGFADVTNLGGIMSYRGPVEM